MSLRVGSIAFLSEANKISEAKRVEEKERAFVYNWSSQPATNSSLQDIRTNARKKVDASLLKLEKIVQQLNTIPGLNSGGCCYKVLYNGF